MHVFNASSWNLWAYILYWCLCLLNSELLVGPNKTVLMSNYSWSKSKLTNNLFLYVVQSIFSFILNGNKL